MAGISQCPSCGESEELRGEPHEDGIRITCLACTAQWMRGAPQCARCGGTDIVERPQAMTRHSRGTQLSIIGWRQIALCRICDADALTTSIEQNVPVPGDYVPASLYGGDTQPGAPSRPPRTAPAGSTPTESAKTAEPPRSAPKPVAAPAPPPNPAPEKASSVSRAWPRPQRSRPQPAASAVPTVRQAIAAFMAEATDTDATAMLLLGTHLGSHNRLSVLDDHATGDALVQWCQGHWPDRDTNAARRALGTICRALDFWGARGWLGSDPLIPLR